MIEDKDRRYSEYSLPCSLIRYETVFHFSLYNCSRQDDIISDAGVINRKIYLEENIYGTKEKLSSILFSKIIARFTCCVYNKRNVRLS